jgi:multidrug efflux pump subunit AcrB
MKKTSSTTETTPEEIKGDNISSPKETPPSQREEMFTSDQKKYIEEHIKENGNLLGIVRVIFNNEELDERSVQYSAVRTYLAQNDISYITSSSKNSKSDFSLTDENKKFIDNSILGGMTTMNIAMLLFSDKFTEATKSKIPLSREYRAILAYVRGKFPGHAAKPEKLISDIYIAPKSISVGIKKVNAFCFQSLIDTKLNANDKKCIEKLITYLGSPRFIQVINTYKNVDDRELFEAEYIRSVWDKPDLTSDDINLYINVCMDYVNQKHIEEQKEKLNAMFDAAENQEELTMRLTDMLKVKSDEYNQCSARMDKLISKLNGDRAKRLEINFERNANFTAIVQAFQDEEERKRMILMTNMQKKTVEEEAKRLESMSEWKARILGEAIPNLL